MKIKDGFILRNVADTYMIVPVGDSFVDFSSVITTNETGAFIWELLKEPKTKEDLVKADMAEFEGASADEVSSDIDEFIDALEDNNILAK